jgi:hypothetical protein
VWLGAVVAAAMLYRPALHGAFVFDDLGLPFYLTLAETSLASWLNGTRPVLMFTYWLNFNLSGANPFSYHLLNVLIHAINTALVFGILACILQAAGWAKERVRIASVIGAAIFLSHPLATESVSYVAGRSESLAAMFVLMAYAIFLQRRSEGISWHSAVGILTLFGLGVAAKENAVALAGILLLTDWYFPPRRTWRLYSVLAPGAILAVAMVLRALTRATTAGFSVRDFTWYQYAFTEARAIFTYLRLAVWPFGQSVDHDYAVSHTIGEHGAWIYVLALACLVVLAVHFRRRIPLISFGLLMFLTWLAPTSSIVPIADPLVERRMYLPMIGLILISCGLAAHVRISSSAAYSAIAAAVLFFAAFSYDRNRLWGKPEELLASAALQSVDNPRPIANLTDHLIAVNRCTEALPWLERAERRLPGNYLIETSWGRALECLGRWEEALARLQRAVQLRPTWKLFELMGLLYGEMNRLDSAGDALRTAVAMEPAAGSAHRSLALWSEAVHDLRTAEREYREALALDPNDHKAQLGLGRVLAATVEPARPIADSP